MLSYPLGSDLSGGWRYLPFEQPEPERQLKYAVTQYDTCMTTCMYYKNTSIHVYGLSFVLVT